MRGSESPEESLCQSSVGHDAKSPCGNRPLRSAFNRFCGPFWGSDSTLASGLFIKCKRAFELSHRRCMASVFPRRKGPKLGSVQVETTFWNRHRARRSCYFKESVSEWAAKRFSGRRKRVRREENLDCWEGALQSIGMARRFQFYSDLKSRDLLSRWKRKQGRDVSICIQCVFWMLLQTSPYIALNKTCIIVTRKHANLSLDKWWTIESLVILILLYSWDKLFFQDLLFNLSFY